MSEKEAFFDYLRFSIANQDIEILGDTQESRYTPFLTLFDIKPEDIETNQFFGTFLRKPQKGVSIKATRRSIELTYSGKYFLTKNSMKRLKAHLNFFSRHYEGLIRFNRIDLAMVLPSKNGDPEEILYFNKNNKVKKRKNTGFQASKFYSLDDEDLKTDGIYFGNKKTRRLVLYNIAQEIEAHKNNENKEKFYKNNLKESYETSIKAEIRCINRASLTNKHLYDLLDGNFNKIYKDLTEGFFRDFVLQTKEGNQTRLFKSLKSKFLNAKLRD